MMNPEVKKDQFKIIALERSDDGFGTQQIFHGEIQFGAEQCAICLTAYGEVQLRLDIGNYTIYDDNPVDIEFMTVRDAQIRIVDFLNESIKEGTFKGIIKQALEEPEIFENQDDGYPIF